VNSVIRFAGLDSNRAHDTVNGRPMAGRAVG